MKLLQVNIWGGRLEPHILKMVRDYGPDILCLQEVIDVDGGGLGIYAALEDIQKAMGADHSFMSPVFTLNRIGREEHFGNAILSKYPITDKQTLFTRKEYVKDFDFIDGDYNIRNLQIATIELPDNKVKIMNHHGHHVPEHKNGDDETMRQCKLIAEEIKIAGGNVILAGDFNLAPNSESLEQINKLLTNLSLLNNLDTTRNQLTHKREVCDYIFTDKDIKVVSFGALDDIVSDHKALYLEFE